MRIGPDEGVEELTYARILTAIVLALATFAAVAWVFWL